MAWQNADGRKFRSLLRLVELESRIQPSNPAPVAGDDFTDTDGNNPVTIAVLENDAAVPPATLVPSSVTVVSPPPRGTVSDDPTTCDITYTATGFFMGTDSFGYRVTDSTGKVSNTAQVSVVVNRPTANDDFADTDGNNPVTIAVLENDTDP